MSRLRLQTAHFFLWFRSYRYKMKEITPIPVPTMVQMSISKEDMYIAPLGKNFPRKLYTRPHSAFAGWQATVCLLYSVDLIQADSESHIVNSIAYYLREIKDSTFSGPFGRTTPQERFFRIGRPYTLRRQSLRAAGGGPPPTPQGRLALTTKETCIYHWPAVFVEPVLLTFYRRML